MEIGLLIGIPFFTSLVLFILGKRASGFAGVLASLATAAGLVVSLLIIQKPMHFEIPWITATGFSLSLSIEYGLLASVMLPLVHGVALAVHIYSGAYLKGEPAISRYFAFLQLFLFSMVGILLSGNLIVLYIFWELVGLSSYLLIGFWNQKPRTVWAAQKAFILNRIGDAAFLSGILLLLYSAGTVHFAELPEAIAQINPGLLSLTGLLLFGGCIGKSAQFPLSGWLPDAMEGPTPVSALIHAATMVAAGIFLMARIAFLLTPEAEMVVAIIGLITMADGAIRACSAWDIKRVLAYSTQSQLGLMVFSVGLGTWEMAIFHLVTHAFFKAGLFLSAGSVIHAMNPAAGKATSFDQQDMRTMGGLRSRLPITFLCYSLCAAALAGLPFFSGFLSKDAIFLAAMAKAADWGFGAYLALGIALISAGLTAFYMTRQLWLVFLGTARYDEALVHPHESPAQMWVPTATLTVFSFFFFFSPNPIDASHGWLPGMLHYEGGYHSALVPLLSLIALGTGIMVALRKSEAVGGFFEERGAPRLLSSLSLLRDYREDRRFTEFFLAPFQYIASAFRLAERYLVDGLVMLAGLALVEMSRIAGWVDRRVVDGLVVLTSQTALRAGAMVRTIHNGRIQSYYLATFISIILLVIWLVTSQ